MQTEFPFPTPIFRTRVG